MPAANSILVYCTQCATPISRPAKHRKITKKPFCGFKCYGAWQRIHKVGVGRVRTKVKCLNCKKCLSKQPNQILTSGRAFCNGPCYWEWRRKTAFLSGSDNVTWKGGGVAYRGPNWSQQAKARRAIDKDTCQHCGVVSPTHPVHHLRPFRLFGKDYQAANDLANLLTLCSTCHGLAEQKFWKDNPDIVPDPPFPIRPTRVCKDCNNEFISRSGSSNSCDRCCTRPCGNCGANFYRRRGRDKDVVYCSRFCWNKSIAVTVPSQICVACKSEYSPNKRGTRYCSRLCRLKNDPPRKKKTYNNPLRINSPTT